jgi:acetyltransferase-like isoleucine patch superfamily enzyme
LRSGGSLKSFAKATASVIARAIVFPAACLAGFGRYHEIYLCFAEILAFLPGLPGRYLRVAYYRFTLDRVGPDCEIAVGTYFAHATSSLGAKVGIGAYCVLGCVDIGQGSLLASGVQVLSGIKQHARDGSGNLTDEGRSFRRISIGPQCWIGAGAIIAADVGAKATIGPGSVVTQDVPEGANVFGNPARDFTTMAKLMIRKPEQM